MVNFDFENMISKGMTADEINKIVQDEIAKAKTALNKKEAEKKLKEAKEKEREKLRVAAVDAVSAYFNALGYKNYKVDIDSAGVYVEFDWENNKKKYSTTFENIISDFFS